MPLAQLRAAVGQTPLCAAPALAAQRRSCPGPGGALELQVFRDPNARAQQPGVVCFAGAGFVLGEIAGHAAFCAALARAAECVVVSVATRLAPEHPFPAPIEDAYCALCHVHEYADDFGIDHARLAVLGASSGGTLATVAARLAKERRNPPLALQVLLCPITDLRSFDTPSHREFAALGPFDAACLRRFADDYASTEQRADPRCSPLAACNLIGVPPALILTAECDPTRDEAEAYAAALGAAHVPVTLRRHSGMVHGFSLLHSQLSAAAGALQECAAALRAAWGVRAG
jgi:acetyl esterase